MKQGGEGPGAQGVALHGCAHIHSTCGLKTWKLPTRTDDMAKASHENAVIAGGGSCHADHLVPNPALLHSMKSQPPDRREEQGVPLVSRGHIDYTMQGSGNCSSPQVDSRRHDNVGKML